MNGKGWHNETARHSEARLYGRASGTQKSLKAPSMPKAMSSGNTVFYKMPNGKVVRAGSSWKVGAYKNVMKQFDEADKKQLAKETKEHPTLPKETVAQIVVDHKEMKETPEQIEKDYNAVSKPEYQTYKYDKNKIEGKHYEIGNFSTQELEHGAKVYAENEKELERIVKVNYPNYEVYVSETTTPNIFLVYVERRK